METEEEGALKPVKWYRELRNREERNSAGAFLVEGHRSIGQILAAAPEAIIEILSTNDQSSVYSKYRYRQLTPRQLKMVSSTRTPQDTIAVVRLPQETYSSSLPPEAGDRILLLEDVQDSGNTGTLIRTAAAFGYAGVILTDKCADPFSPKCVQSSTGTVLSLWLRRTSDYLEMVGTLKSRGYILIGMDLRGNEDLSLLESREKLVLALGNEAAGLSEPLLKACDSRIKIPVIREKAESLNVASCGAIGMYLSSRAI